MAWWLQEDIWMDYSSHWYATLAACVQPTLLKPTPQPPPASHSMIIQTCAYMCSGDELMAREWLNVQGGCQSSCHFMDKSL